MSQAHRPTWNPTQGRETKAGSQQISKLALASHTRLKFRQPGQTSSLDVARRDLRAELIAAERAAEDKKRKAAGLPPLPPLAGSGGGSGNSGLAGLIADTNGGKDDGNVEDGEDEATKRRKILEEAAELDKDDDNDDQDDDDDEDERVAKENKSKGKAIADADDDDEEEDDDDDEDDSDDDDDAAALMAELAKIKQERAEEKARLEAEALAASNRDREAEIATGNPLLNLAAALSQSSSSNSPSQTPASSSTSSIIGGKGGFAVKRRWDDDLIFKNQASALDDKPKKGEFVNDLLRSEFHKKFMYRFIK